MAVHCRGLAPAALESGCVGVEQSGRERLHQPRVKRKEEGNRMQFSYTGFGRHENQHLLQPL